MTQGAMMAQKFKHRKSIEDVIAYLCKSLEMSRKELAALFKEKGVSLRRMDEEIQEGVLNGYSPEVQLEVFKDTFSDELTEFKFGANV